MSATTVTGSPLGLGDIAKHLGEQAKYFLEHQCKTIPKDQLHLPGPDFVDRIWVNSDRSPAVLRSLQSL